MDQALKSAKGLGSTEMVGAATTTREECNTIGNVGIPLVRVNCKIVEPDTYDELSYNQVGEISFSGDTLMLGYYNKQEATDAIIKYHADGVRWMHTGDLGYVNENGVVFITGRIKKILMTIGKDGQPTKMFPDRIEKVVMNHPAVALCCVIGIPDQARMNYPRAYVILNEGYTESQQTTEALLLYCKEELPEYMIPEEVVYRKEFPRTPRDKVDYRALDAKRRKPCNGLRLQQMFLPAAANTSLCAGKPKNGIPIRYQRNKGTDARLASVPFHYTTL